MSKKKKKKFVEKSKINNRHIFCSRTKNAPIFACSWSEDFRTSVCGRTGVTLMSLSGGYERAAPFVHSFLLAFTIQTIITYNLTAITNRYRKTRGFGRTIKYKKNVDGRAGMRPRRASTDGGKIWSQCHPIGITWNMLRYDRWPRVTINRSGTPASVPDRTPVRTYVVRALPSKVLDFAIRVGRRYRFGVE